MKGFDRSDRRHTFSAPWVALLLGFCCMVSPAYAANISWTGQAGDGLWSNTNNWEGGVLPGSSDIAVFGNTATNGPHHVIVDDAYTIDRILISGGDLRSFQFSAGGGGQLTCADRSAFEVASGVTADVLFGVPLYTLNAGAPYIDNNSACRVILTELLDTRSVGGDTSAWFRNGAWEMAGDFNIDGLTLTNTDIRWNMDGSGNNRGILVMGTGTHRILLEQDLYFARDLSVRFAPLFEIGIVDSGAEDRVISFGWRLRSDSSDNARITFLENDAHSTGRLIMRTAGNTDAGTRRGDHTLAMDTRANTYIRFDHAGTARMTYELNTNSNRAMRITGEGHLWKSGTGTLWVQTDNNTYSGRTMISEGTLRLDSFTIVDGEGDPVDTLYGQLPAATHVEIGAGATFDLNGIHQTVGGLRDWTGLDQTNAPTAGSVALGGATLTVNAAQASAFGGQVTGAGTLVKAGAGTFTLSSGYTNAVDRTLRVEEGLLAITGILSVEEGEFELAGGRITAGGLEAADTVWNVTLTAGSAEQILVDVVGTADVTGATLELALAGGYEPALNTRFTLLRADTIDGASEAGLFGRAQGDDFRVGDTHFLITFEPGSERAVLTVIPEPGSLLLLLPAGMALVLRRRRSS